MHLLSLSSAIAALGIEAQSATTLATRMGVPAPLLRRRMQRLVDQSLVVVSREGRSLAYRILGPEDQLQNVRAIGPKLRLMRIDVRLQGAWLLKGALENVARVGMGQIEQVTTAFRWENFGKQPRFTLVQLDDAELIINGMKRWLLDPGFSAARNTLAPHLPEKMHLCWALHRAIRFRIAWDRRPEGGLGVDFDEPMPYELIPGVTVTSSADEQGAPWIHIEMTVPTAKTVAMALRANARLLAGDFAVVVDLACEGLVRNARADIASDASRAVASAFTKQIADVLNIAPEGPLPPECAQSIGMADAFSRALSKPRAKPSHFVGVDAVDVEAFVHGVSKGPMPVAMSVLPTGYIAHRKGGKYRVIGPDDSPNHLRIVSESDSLQTALLMALNVAQGGRGRDWTL